VPQGNTLIDKKAFGIRTAMTDAVGHQADPFPAFFGIVYSPNSGDSAHKVFRCSGAVSLNASPHFSLRVFFKPDFPEDAFFFY
jgi:hypothetical protein